ncbi:MAG: hypothetical protein C4346_15070 [Chloroflexota bacterium]
MPDRKCQTCKHYEPSPIRRKGWCRNPRLYSPQQSHLVDQDDLDCGHRLGNYWEPAEPAEPAGDDQTSLGDTGSPLLPDFPETREPALAVVGNGAAPEMKPERQTVRLNAVASERVTIGAESSTRAWSAGGSSVSSGSSGSIGGGPTGSGSRTSGGSASSGVGGSTPPGSVPPRRGGGPPPGQERTVSYQPEERYWTDYVRVALPVLGLLLLLGLFWYWARNLIGDEANEPTGTPADVALIGAATFTPTATQPAGAVPIQTADTAAQTQTAEPTPTGSEAGQPDTGNSEPTPRPTRTPRASTQETPTTEAAPSRFQEGDLVVVNENDVNLRADPSLNGEVRATLSQGTELRILSSEPREANGYVWWNVEVTETGETGWVAEDFIAAS